MGILPSSESQPSLQQGAQVRADSQSESFVDQETRAAESALQYIADGKGPQDPASPPAKPRWWNIGGHLVSLWLLAGCLQLCFAWAATPGSPKHTRPEHLAKSTEHAAGEVAARLTQVEKRVAELVRTLERSPDDFTGLDQALSGLFADLHELHPALVYEVGVACVARACPGLGPELDAPHFGYVRGQLRNFELDYEHRDEAWFRAGIVDDAGWYGPYLGQTTRRVVVGYMAPVRDDASGRVLAVARVNISSRQLSSICVSAIATTGFIVGTALLWDYALQPWAEDDESTAIRSHADLGQRLAELYRDPGRRELPVGLLVQSVEFVTANNVEVHGHLWERHVTPLASPEAPSIEFPESIDRAFELDFRRSEVDARGRTVEVVGWRFKLVLRVPFDYASYPFDHKTVWLRMRA